MKPTEIEDSRPYFRFTSPARMDKAFHTLEGLVQGIAADTRVSDIELAELTKWISAHSDFAKFHPFNEVIPRLNEIINRRIVDEETVADILWLSNKFTTSNEYYDLVSSDMQRLQGMLHGILADGKITKEELETLERWMEEREHLKSCWPYDEIESLIVTVLADGVIDDQEHETLTKFFGEFCRANSENAVDPVALTGNFGISGVCAMCPDIEFTDRTFCFTGSSGNNTRKELAEMVHNLGANHSNRINRKVDYLVVCCEGNQCWAYSCYGRKVEQAVAMRKKGERILLIHETDFRDAIQDLD